MTEVSDGKGTQARPARHWLASRLANTVRYSLMNLFLIAGIAGVTYGGIWSSTGILLSFVLIGFVDELFGDSGDKEAMPPIWYMQAMLYLTLPLLVLLTLLAFNTNTENGWWFLDAICRAVGIDPEAARLRTNWWDSIGAVFSVGMFYGVAGVNVAHELVHRTDSKLDYIVGRWLLAFSWDTGFAIEHVHGHHRNVGTELDPATAKRGEYIFSFIGRSTRGQFRNAYNIEKARLKRRGQRDLGYNSKFWRGLAMSGVVILMYVVFLGPIVGLVLTWFTARIGKAYLELVNYIEHYGLVRIPGTPVDSRHSWDSYRRVSSGLLYNLQLHAHHHRAANRKFWELEPSHGQAPVLPYGYMASIFIAFVPGLWEKVTREALADWDRRLASPAEREYLKSKGLLLG